MKTAQSHGGFFENVSLNFERASSFTNHPQWLLHQLKVCNSVYSFRFPVRTRRGHEVISGWRVQHSHHKLRFIPDRSTRSHAGQVILSRRVVCAGVLKQPGEESSTGYAKPVAMLKT
jgi:hypothetical protein